MTATIAPRYRWLWLLALAAGASYFFAARSGLGPPAIVVWKGAGVALLALWAGLHARSRDGWLLTLFLALGATGDVLIETAGLRTGGMVFLAGHIVAIVLFARNLRHDMSPSQKALALVLAVTVPAIAAGLSASSAQAIGHAAYGLGLGVMAAAAWASRFSRYRVGIGAIFFVLSDMLIFARGGALAGSQLPALLIWPLYFAGQALIAWGVVGRLNAADASATRAAAG
ncbi:MAG: lysoplasmalogenase [Sphingomonadales bacterium]|nr:lysoplasmalogenase [Sphingomonadales bacterium]